MSDVVGFALEQGNDFNGEAVRGRVRGGGGAWRLGLLLASAHCSNWPKVSNNI